MFCLLFHSNLQHHNHDIYIFIYFNKIIAFFFTIWKLFPFFYFIKLFLIFSLSFTFPNLLSIILISLVLFFILSSSVLLLLKSFLKLRSEVLLSDFKRLMIKSSFVNFSVFLILLNLAIYFNSFIDFLPSFLAWFNLAIFSSLFFW